MNITGGQKFSGTLAFHEENSDSSSPYALSVISSMMASSVFNEGGENEVRFEVEAGVTMPPGLAGYHCEESNMSSKISP